MKTKFSDKKIKLNNKEIITNSEIYNLLLDYTIQTLPRVFDLRNNTNKKRRLNQ